MSNAFRAGSALFAVLSCLVFPLKAQVISEYEYAPDKIYQVRTALGITTQIELSPTEKILDYSTGFSNGWELSRRENVFYLKPKNVDVDTNFLVRTERHSYIFELKVVATDWTALEQAKNAGAQYKITFRYPGGTEPATAEPSVPQTQLSVDLEKDRAYNFDYAYKTRTKHTWLIPVSTYDDGRFTYIKLSNLTNIPTGNFPVVFGRERERGDDFVVNSTVKDNTIVVHGVYPYLVVRHGSDVIGLRRSQPQ
ncbi:Type IV secretory pathway, VirB9 component [Pseudoxanthomonas dokdonensis]|uniref:Type IV secretory pathway, VirB9 component n=1 Tax=Pseudoxanthomonas dokdonensis TaxID=344882 RepID=A0A0R0D2G4_9GAMM|nr:TrbG/VirB9 family P-type conjugative transfer protein [Pseudoxanthomonas dokdonensis]KRG72132.1 Type IV secretory pathway, VirB9 component [Pseudoxanthomonas dokdonensis]